MGMEKFDEIKSKSFIEIVSDYASPYAGKMEDLTSEEYDSILEKAQLTEEERKIIEQQHNGGVYAYSTMSVDEKNLLNGAENRLKSAAMNYFSEVQK